MPQVYTELFTGQMIEKLRFVGRWPGLLQNANEFVGNKVIHIADIGDDPAVLINATGGFTAVALDDDELTYSLVKFDTVSTKITDDELYAIAYDKVGSVVNRHRRAMEQQMRKYGLHNLAPNSNVAATPVLRTTGADDGTGRKRLTVSDVVALKKEFDDREVPEEGRVLVLNNEHISDLLLINESFERQYMNIREGRVLQLHGFMIYQDVYAPRYNRTTLAKVAFGAAAAGTDGSASTAFWAPDCLRAVDSIKFYYLPETLNPEGREQIAGFRGYHLIAPYKRRSQAAIVSDAA